ncbi:MAG: cation diffusion facilitator family transporter [Propionibacteriaceae bacterium]
MSSDQTAGERRLLLFSIWASAGFAVFSSLWGILSGSSMIVFDGLYSFVSIGLSGLALLALRFVRRGPDEQFPWGREAAEPVVVILKAATLGALCVYAGIGGVVDLLSGGTKVEVGWAIVYAVIATAASLAVGLVLRRGTRSQSSKGPGKDLVRSEAAEWLGDALLSVGVLVGFVVALLLTSRGRADLAAYVDPAMVVLVSTAFLVVPLRLVIGGMREVMSMSPPEDVQSQLRAAVDEVGTRYGLEESFVRAAKVGGRMDIEVDYVVEPESRVVTVTDCDAVRSDLHERLAALGYQKSVVVAFTTDRRWAE